MSEYNWVIRHKETLQYYMGSEGYPRWSKTLQQAKKYRRLGDVGNAVTLAVENHYFKRSDLKVLRYRLEFDGEEPERRD